MSISDGVLANAANFNAAFESKNKTVVSKTSNYTATSSDFLINCDATSASFTITLPDAASNYGKIYEIYKTDSSVNTVTIDGNGSETIGSYTTKVLTSQYHGVLIICDGSKWEIKAEFQENILTYVKNADYTILAYDQFIRSDNTGGNLTFTLPALSSVQNGKKYTFRRGSGALGNTTTITRAGSDVIGTSTGTTVNSVILATPGEFLELVAISGLAWIVTNRTTYSGWTDYTPTLGGFTAGVGTVTAKWKRDGENVECQVNIPITGAVTGTTLTIPLPSGLTFSSTNAVSTAFLNGAQTQNMGGVIFDTSASSYYHCSAMRNTSSSVFVAYLGSGTSGQYLGVSATGPVTLANGDTITLRFGGPITNWEG